MEEATVRKLRFLALQVVGAVAVVHLVTGVAELVKFANAGLFVAYFTNGQALTQPEPWLFPLSGLAVLGGAVAVGLGYLDYRRAYALGAAVMLGYLLGWLAWHSLLDHGLLGAGEATADDHGHSGLFEVVASHYVGPLVGIFGGADRPGRATLAVVSKSLEVVAIVLLSVLYWFDPRVEDAESPVAAMGETEGD
jgi:hypothetical protein